MNSYGLGGKKRNLDKKTKINNQEKVLAKKLGGRRQINSGATAKEKGDVKTPDILYDSKSTIDSKITVTSEMLAKITYEARQVNRFPGLLLTLQVGLTVPAEWAMIPLDYHTMLMEELRILRKLNHVISNGKVEGCPTESSSEGSEGNQVERT